MPKKLPERSIMVERVRAKLIENRGHYGELAKCTGLTSRWVTQFAQGVIIDPGAARLETLARALGFRFRYSMAREMFKPHHRGEYHAAVSKAIREHVYGATGE